MTKRARLLAGLAVLGAAIIGPPQSAEAASYTLRVGGRTCYASVAKISSTWVQSYETGCDKVQARMTRYYAGVVRHYYGPLDPIGSKVVATDGTYIGGAVRIQNGSSTSSWYSA
ncbi:MAG: hypothetical protein ACRC0L_01415 [Angustibacter sp.]